MNMLEVTFDDDPEIEFPTHPDKPPKQKLSLLQMVQKWGLAKDEHAANKILLVVAGGALTLTVGIFVVVTTSDSSALTAAQQSQVQKVGAIMQQRGIMQ